MLYRTKGTSKSKIWMTSRMMPRAMMEASTRSCSKITLRTRSRQRNRIARLVAKVGLKKIKHLTQRTNLEKNPTLRTDLNSNKNLQDSKKKLMFCQFLTKRVHSTKDWARLPLTLGLSLIRTMKKRSSTNPKEVLLAPRSLQALREKVLLPEVEEEGVEETGVGAQVFNLEHPNNWKMMF
jgi:hypothetical protein